MVVGNHPCNAANRNQSKPQFQLELSLAQFSPSLSCFFCRLLLDSEFSVHLFLWMPEDVFAPPPMWNLVKPELGRPKIFQDQKFVRNQNFSNRRILIPAFLETCQFWT